MQYLSSAIPDNSAPRPDFSTKNRASRHVPVREDTV